MIREVYIYTPWRVFSLHVDDIDYGKLHDAWMLGRGNVDVTDENGLTLCVDGADIKCLLSRELTAPQATVPARTA